MKVEVDMEKISSEIAAAEEAARKRMVEREKDIGERGAKEAPACVLAEEEKHICATHGNKQNSLNDSGNKDGNDTDATTHAPGELCCFCVSGLQVFNMAVTFLFCCFREA